MRKLVSMVVIAAVLCFFGGVSAQDALLPTPPEGYVNASEILDLPEFIPGIGSLCVHPDSAPIGPWLSHGQGGTLVGILLMVPVSEMTENDANWTDLAADLFATMDFGDFDHVDVTFDPGHPGLAEPYYHVRMVLVDSETQEQLLSE